MRRPPPTGALGRQAGGSRRSRRLVAYVAPGARRGQPAATGAGLDRAARVRRPAGTGALHRHRGQGRRDDRAHAGRRPARRAGARERSAATSRPASPPTSSTGSATSSSCDHGAYPSTLGYKGFPKSLCTSVNEVICHGIPDARVVEDGDIVNIDITAFIDGVHGDTNATFLAGDVDEESRLLVERTHEALERAIKAVAPGRAGQRHRPGDRVATRKRFGYGVVRDFTGHGIGTAFHSGLIVPHYDDPRYDHRDGDRDDVHDRADAHPRHLRVRHVGRRLDRRDRRPPPHRAVRAHRARHRARRRDPDHP